MKEIHLEVDDLQSICAQNDVCGQGSYGIVYKLDDKTLFKFNYKDFIECFPMKNNKFDTRCLSDISDTIDNRKKIESIVYKDKERSIIENIRRASKQQRKMKYNTLTKGLVYCNDYCVGYLLHNHKDMVSLYNYVIQNGLTDAEKEIVLKGIQNSVQELMQHNIYHYDLTTRNILLNPQTKEIQIIDFEDQIQVDDSPDKCAIKKMNQQLHSIELFFDKHLKEVDHTL